MAEAAVRPEASGSGEGRRPPVLLGAATAVGFWLLGLVGALDGLDGPAYDALHRAWPPAADAAPQVVLVEWGPDERVDGPDPGLRVLTVLRALGARGVVFTAAPPGAGPEFFRAAREGDVVIGRAIVTDPDGIDEPRPEDWPAAGGEEVPSGVVVAPRVERGVVRSREPTVRVGSQSLPTLEAAAARRLALEVAVPAEPYRVAFRGGPGSLPHAPVRTLLSGGLVPELVRGRVVVVGPPSRPDFPAAVTPTTPPGRWTSGLEFHGQALNTLLSGTRVRTLTPAERLVLLLSLAGTAALLYQWLNARAALWACLALLLAYLGAVVVLFARAAVWVPVAEAAGALVGCLLLVERQKAYRAFRSARRLLLGLSADLRDRQLPPSFYDAPEHWALIAGFVRQTLDLDRIAFLEADGRRLRVAACFGTSAQEVRDPNPTLAREPFASCVKSGRPVRLDPARPLLTPADGPEHQFLAPLAFADRVLGFWVVTASPAAADAIPNFLDLLADHSQQFGELLYHRRQVREEANRGTRLGRLISRDAEEAEYEDLARAVGSLERRLERSERLFADSVTAVASFDLFGRLRELNGAMRSYLQGVGLAPYSMTAADLVAAVTGRGLPFARRCVRHVLHDRRDLSLPVEADDGTRHWLLRVYPLEAAPAGAGGEPGPLPLGGVCCELSDQTAAVRLRQLKEQLVGRVGVHLRNDLAAVELSASLLASEGLSELERADIGQMVHDKIAEIVQTLADAEKFYAAETHDDAARLPVDPHDLFLAAANGAEPAARARGVTFAVTRPKLLEYTLAPPEALRRLFAHALALLARDARPNTAVAVEVVEAPGGITYTLRNDGFGLPGARLRQYLLGNDDLADADLQALRQSAHEATDWGGRVTADSTPGAGIALTIHLPRFG